MEQTKQVSQKSLEKAIIELPPLEEGTFNITMVVNELLFLNVGTRIEKYLNVCKSNNIIPFSTIKFRYENESYKESNTSLTLNSEDNNKLKEYLLKGGKIAMVLYEGRGVPLTELKKDLKISISKRYSIESGCFDFSPKHCSGAHFPSIDLKFVGGPKGKIEFYTYPNKDYYKQLYDWFKETKK